MKKIVFKPNIEKAIEVILWFCEQKNNHRINKYNLLKALFYAEVDHLNRFGRPIVGDTYHALEYGTVPSLVRDLIEKNRFRLNSLDIHQLPFELKGNDIQAKRHSRNSVFSKSDIQCLERAFTKCGNLPFGKLCNLNHENKGWQETWKKNPNSPIPFELLIKDESLIEDLQETSRNMVI